MNENKDDKKLYELLSMLKDVTHLPVDFLFADAAGKLSADGHMRVQEHVNDCPECAKILELAQDFVKEEAVDSEGADVPVSQKLLDKLELYEILTSKRDRISEEVAKLFLPEDMWFMIKPVLSVRESAGSGFDESNKEAHAVQLRAAAFSQGSVEHEPYFEMIEKIAEYVDQVCDMLLQSSNSCGDIKKQLPVVWAKSVSTLPELDEVRVRDCILSIVETDKEK